MHFLFKPKEWIGVSSHVYFSVKLKSAIESSFFVGHFILWSPDGSTILGVSIKVFTFNFLCYNMTWEEVYA